MRSLMQLGHTSKRIVALLNHCQKSCQPSLSCLGTTGVAFLSKAHLYTHSVLAFELLVSGRWCRLIPPPSMRHGPTSALAYAWENTAMAMPWLCGGAAGAPSYHCYGTGMSLPWHCHGAAPPLPWHSRCSYQRSVVALPGIDMALSWCSLHGKRFPTVGNGFQRLETVSHGWKW